MTSQGETTVSTITLPVRLFDSKLLLLSLSTVLNNSSFFALVISVDKCLGKIQLSVDEDEVCFSQRFAVLRL